MSTEIHVRNIGSYVRPRDVEHLFARFGTVREVVMVVRSASAPDGPEAIVGMGSEEECRAAVNGLNGSAFHGAFLDLRAVQADPAAGAAVPEVRMFGPMNISEGESWDDDGGAGRGRVVGPAGRPPGGDAR